MVDDFLTINSGFGIVSVSTICKKKSTVYNNNFLFCPRSDQHCNEIG